jgi:hypothetical protein
MPAGMRVVEVDHVRTALDWATRKAVVEEP